MYLDWARFSELCAQCSVRFEWSSEKDGRRMQAKEAVKRSALFQGRVARIRVEDALCDITDPDLVRMYFDGISPRSIIEATIASVQHIKARAEADPTS
jgi:hypothetical protein